MLLRLYKKYIHLIYNKKHTEASARLLIGQNKTNSDEKI